MNRRPGGPVIITPPDTSLAAKVKTGKGMAEAEFRDIFEGAIARMRDKYQPRMLELIQQAAAEAKTIAGAAAISGDTVQPLFKIAHELKGSAGTFDYDLVSQAAEVLCEVLRRGRFDDARFVDVVQTCTGTLATLGAAALDGSWHKLQGERGKTLLANLRKAAERVMKEIRPDGSEGNF